MVLLTYIATPPPCAFLSFRIMSWNPSISNKSSLMPWCKCVSERVKISYKLARDVFTASYRTFMNKTEQATFVKKWHQLLEERERMKKQERIKIIWSSWDIWTSCWILCYSYSVTSDFIPCFHIVGTGAREWTELSFNIFYLKRHCICNLVSLTQVAFGMVSYILLHIWAMNQFLIVIHVYWTLRGLFSCCLLIVLYCQIS